MHSSTFNFDFAAVAKALSTTIITILIAWVVVPARLPGTYDERAVFGAQTYNKLVLERYTFDGRDNPIVFVGSSIMTGIPPLACRPDNVASIYVQGGGPVTGLEVIRRVGAAPQLVFVDMQGLILGVDYNLIDAVFTPLYWHVRALVPPLRLNRNWFVLLYRKEAFARTPDKHVIDYPTQTVAEWNAQRASFFAPYIQQGSAGAAVKTAIDDLTERVRELRQRGTRVIIFNPMDPRIRRNSPSRDLTMEIRLRMPDVELINAPDEEFPIYRYDGLHFTAASGLQFFEYLMNRANAQFSSKCQLLPPPPGEKSKLSDSN
jgi:hypothetical protein